MMDLIMWLAVALNLGVMCWYFLQLRKLKQRERALSVDCRHDFKRVGAQTFESHGPNASHYTVVLMRCRKCPEARSEGFPGKWDLAHFDPPSAEDLQRIYER